jgi:Armadillo/beta-catenin-like repeat
VVLEYSTLCLSSLAQEFTAKVAISSSGGLRQLVKCISSKDPDVVKNAIEAISLTVQVCGLAFYTSDTTKHSAFSS